MIEAHNAKKRTTNTTNRSFLLEEVSGLIQEPDMNKTPIALVDEMLRYRDRYDDLLDESCSSVFKGSSAKRRDPQFEREIQSAFVTLVNKNERYGASSPPVHTHNSLSHPPQVR